MKELKSLKVLKR